jgi:hypothetical protein
MVKFVKLEEDDWAYDDADFYSADARDALVDEDAMSPIEAGFMKGWEDAGRWVESAYDDYDDDDDWDLS